MFVHPLVHCFNAKLSDISAVRLRPACNSMLQLKNAFGHDGSGEAYQNRQLPTLEPQRAYHSLLQLKKTLAESSEAYPSEAPSGFEHQLDGMTSSVGLELEGSQVCHEFRNGILSAHFVYSLSSSIWPWTPWTSQNRGSWSLSSEAWRTTSLGNP
jgi:hypothetical protein